MIYVTLLLSIFSSLSTAQIMTLQKPVICWQGDFYKFKSNMDKEYKEELKAFGITDDNKTIIEWYENEDTGTWTLVERKDDSICIIATGNKGSKL